MVRKMHKNNVFLLAGEEEKKQDWYNVDNISYNNIWNTNQSLELETPQKSFASVTILILYESHLFCEAFM